MYLKLKIQQMTKIGMLHSGVPYRFDMKEKKQAEVAKSLLERKVAVEVSQEELEEMAKAAAAAEDAAEPVSNVAGGGEEVGASVDGADDDAGAEDEENLAAEDGGDTADDKPAKKAVKGAAK
ncbi:hypothetical protein [Roseovarius nubinhibens]|uniref:Uncharacterized protein n=1 Tax=Roseovarius nubinhibens TaxID=314263 RepID=A0A348W758_9RHOB|nr:hypothetical protein [Roseovarius nubinhibens]|tara:strand:- start:26109 stop:26474 length:366 start_codon:yes stop_codon:yes gene_type:complete